VAEPLPRPANTTAINLLQWIAMLSMLVDHTVQAFLADSDWMILSSTVGRWAYPIYGALVVWSTLHYPKIDHLIRLWALALISQIPYTLALHSEQAHLPWPQLKLNVCVSLALGATWLQGLVLRSSGRLVTAALLSAPLLALPLRMDYSWVGLAWMGGVALMLVTPAGRWQPFALLAYMAAALLVGLLGSASTPLLSVLSVSCIALALLALLLGLPLPGIAWRPPRVLWRAFYPAHLAIIAMVING
jgi:hypothetical protein